MRPRAMYESSRLAIVIGWRQRQIDEGLKPLWFLPRAPSATRAAAMK